MTKALDYPRLLKNFRKQANMTQEELADELNMTQSHVSKYESGRKIIDLETFMQWVRVTNSEIHAASTMFSTDVLSNALQVIQALPMFIGGFILWI